MRIYNSTCLLFWIIYGTCGKVKCLRSASIKFLHSSKAFYCLYMADKFSTVFTSQGSLVTIFTWLTSWFTILPCKDSKPALLFDMLVCCVHMVNKLVYHLHRANNLVYCHHTENILVYRFHLAINQVCHLLLANIFILWPTGTMTINFHLTSGGYERVSVH